MAASPLEEQRDFLLRSLEDLERERAAGDVDEHDYAALKDDYTARAAAVLRSIEEGRSRITPVAPRSRRRVVLAGLGIVAFAALAGVLVAQALGRRDAGQVVTGDIRQSVTEKLNEAGRRGAAGDLTAAIDLYDEVLADDPSNAEALAYKGWMQTLSGKGADGLTTLLDAATANPSYPDVHAASSSRPVVSSAASTPSTHRRPSATSRPTSEPRSTPPSPPRPPPTLVDQAGGGR